VVTSSVRPIAASLWRPKEGGHPNSEAGHSDRPVSGVGFGSAHQIKRPGVRVSAEGRPVCPFRVCLSMPVPSSARTNSHHKLLISFPPQRKGERERESCPSPKPVSSPIPLHFRGAFSVSERKNAVPCASRPCHQGGLPVGVHAIWNSTFYLPDLSHTERALVE